MKVWFLAVRVRRDGEESPHIRVGSELFIKVLRSINYSGFLTLKTYILLNILAFY